MRRSLVLTILLFAPALSDAAFIHVTPRFRQALDEDREGNLWPTDAANVISADPFHPVLRPREEKYALWIDIYLSIEDVHAPQVGFGSVEFNIDYQPNLSQNPFLQGWQSDTSTVDSNGPDVSGGVVFKFDYNGDYGPSPSDLVGIALGIDPDDFGPVGVDPRRQLGQTVEGEFMGSVFMDVPGRNPLGSLQVVPTAGAVYDDQLNLTTAGTTVVGGEVVIGAVPEPSGWVLIAVSLGVGWACCLSRQRSVLQR